ncbi:PfaD family polyunsaturated fatty acid/polyketide biosynthesis protein [Tundrisphaera lichenicola]|uniref:PfaD family polyunsaturated fatty acid/polyketide biosynthesis protein n=1 Tax=Tundrisphaera lichenicola TaxID=2029860 RepID=UPI003EBE1B1C
MAATIAGEVLNDALGRVARPFVVARQAQGLGLLEAGEPAPPGSVVGYLPACRPESMGDESFRLDHGLRYAYVSGAMANGIGSVEIAEAMGRAGMLGIFGAAGLPIRAVDAAITRLEASLGPAGPYGFNLIHSPNDPALEGEVANLYLRRGVRLVEASAYLDLTLPVVKYRVAGLRRDESGQVVAPNRVIAKVSRVEVASKFLAPPPERFLRELVAQREITEDQARMASEIPMAADVTAEADSGGHTDNQPAIVLIPTMLALRDRLQAQYQYAVPPRIGAAGGISTPWSAAGAFAMGASYVVVGSVNQSCVESGTSDIVRKMLAEAQQADIAMAPAADMFEMGVKVQVLKRGTMFAMRGAKLLEFYRAHDSIERIPAADRAMLEKMIFRAPLEEIWNQTRGYFLERDPKQVERAERDPKHKMALVFRSYLGQSSHWANAGDPSRAVDYQIWCGPAMAAFNEWVRGSFLENPAERRVATVARNILYHAAVLTRARSLAAQGVPIPPGIPRLAPLPVAVIDERSVL